MKSPLTVEQFNKDLPHLTSVAQFISLNAGVELTAAHYTGSPPLLVHLLEIGDLPLLVFMHFEDLPLHNFPLALGKGIVQGLIDIANTITPDKLSTKRVCGRCILSHH